MRKRHISSRLNIYLLFFSAFLQFNNAIGQIELDEEPKRLYYDYTGRVKKFKDMKDFRDVFHYNKLLMGKNRISGNISYNTSRVLIDNGFETHNEIRSAIGFFTRIRFFEQFSFNTTFFKNFNPQANARWNADFTYSLARYNWMPNKFNYGYENYINNRYTDSPKEMKEKFLEGYYFISYSHNLKNVTKKIMIDSTTNIKLAYFTRYSIKYRDQHEKIKGGLDSGKPSLGAGLRITLFWNIYIESAAYYYFDPAFKKQQPWDPDFTYGFGYFDWRSFRCSLTYGNWAVNRFSWNKTEFYPKYGFIDGNFRFITNWIW